LPARVTRQRSGPVWHCRRQDRPQTVASFRRLAALDAETACFGHGEPIASGACDRIREVAATLMP